MKEGQQSNGLLGLVLAGGSSRRMGEDKGRLEFHGLPQAVWLWQQLDELCECAYVSVNAEQSDLEPYSGLPTIIDEIEGIGPAAGLVSAWATHPSAAWLVVAVDMPFIDEDTLRPLLQGRLPGMHATAYRHPDGTLEPLCAIWEAAAQPPLAGRIRAGDTSLRRCLEAGQVRILTPPAAVALTNTNSAIEYRDAERLLAAR
jgi:molybdopterin-guanine dinucleotide biosynthesis protein A